jgi:hypothetical protein
MREVDVAGEYAAQDETNVQMFFHNNYAVNKIDYYLRRTVSTEVRLTEGGEALVTTEVVMENLAPDDPPSLLIGPGVEGDEPGLNRMLFNILGPTSAIFEKIEVDGKDVPLLQYQDGRFPVAWDVLEIPPGDTAQVRVDYRVQDAISVVDGVPRFQFRIIPQTLPNHDRYSITIEAPQGLALAESYPDTPGIRRFTRKGLLDQSRLFDFVIVDRGD